MAIYQKIAVRGVFVLADARFEDWCVLHRGHAARQILARQNQTLTARQPLARVRIKRFAVTINCAFDSPAIDVRQPIGLVFKVNPGRHRRRPKLMVTSRRAEIKDFLTCWSNSLGEQIGKQFWQPGPAGKDKILGCYSPPVRGHNVVRPSAAIRWPDRVLQVSDAGTNSLPNDCPNGSARE